MAVNGLQVAGKGVGIAFWPVVDLGIARRSRLYSNNFYMVLVMVLVMSAIAVCLLSNCSGF